MTEALKAHCPSCDGERACNSHGNVYKDWSWHSPDGEHSIHGGNEHSLLECRGCETVFYQKTSWDSENTDYSYNHHKDEHEEFAIKNTSTFPQSDTKTKPAWVENLFYSDTQLYNILIQMYSSLDREHHILSAIGLRTALDRATEVLGISPSYTFSKKLEELFSGGWIGATEKQVLEVVTDAGNAAAHRGWSPDSKQMQMLVSAFEVFLQRAFIVRNNALQVRENIPTKPKR